MGLRAGRVGSHPDGAPGWVGGSHPYGVPGRAAVLGRAAVRGRVDGRRPKSVTSPIAELAVHFGRVFAA
jgi:hypothetical protein